jgi:hypothetical protein
MTAATPRTTPRENDALTEVLRQVKKIELRTSGSPEVRKSGSLLLRKLLS